MAEWGYGWMSKLGAKHTMLRVGDIAGRMRPFRITDLSLRQRSV